MMRSGTAAPEGAEAGALSRWFVPAAVAAVLLLATFSTAPARLPVSICGFYNLTGLPCPGCGMTRGFVAMGHGDPAGAWRSHPLAPPFFLGLLGYLIWFSARRRRAAARLQLWLSRHRRPLYVLILCTVAAAWPLNVSRHLRHDRPAATPLIAAAYRNAIAGPSDTGQGQGEGRARHSVSASSSRSTPKASSAR